MTKEEFEKSIHDFIECKYKCKFVGRTEIFKEQIDTNLYEYTFNWYIDSNVVPIPIIMQCATEEEFLDYVKQQIVSRNLIRVSYHKMKLEEPEHKTIW